MDLLELTIGGNVTYRHSSVGLTVLLSLNEARDLKHVLDRLLTREGPSAPTGSPISEGTGK